ncbi:MAG: P44/Msp2 family outer membrane protein [Alphaproteobacteria bacterium]|jgi:opacity protein-like surface antigen|nr:P44/Msp2 family outer membrane protein [Alphaproteobacteria bacterium]
MKILNFILFVIFLTSSAFADGFYVGGSIGSTINNNTSINIGGLNKENKTSLSESKHIDETNIAAIPGYYATQIRIVGDMTTNNTYSSILKGISYNEAQNTFTFAGYVGYTLKNFRFEAEVKSISLKIKPKNYIYNATQQQDYSGFITTYCSVAKLNSGYCNKTGVLLDSSDSLYQECPVMDTSGGGGERVCYYNTADIEGSNSNDYNNIVIDGSSGSIFSGDVDNELFSFKAADINSNNILGFMNFIYEAPITENMALFSGVGLGYGMAMLSGDLVNKQNLTYPAYQVKLGASYSITSNIDITLNYSNINMINRIKKGNLEVSDSKIQAVEFGIRYNFSDKESAKAMGYKDIYGDASYAKIFHPDD